MIALLLAALTGCGQPSFGESPSIGTPMKLKVELDGEMLSVKEITLTKRFVSEWRRESGGAQYGQGIGVGGAGAEEYFLEFSYSGQRRIVGSDLLNYVFSDSKNNNLGGWFVNTDQGREQRTMWAWAAPAGPVCYFGVSLQGTPLLLVRDAAVLRIQTESYATLKQVEGQETAAALNSRAWVHATTKVEYLRDPETAVQEAERACKLVGNRDPNCVDTKAAAYAAAGQFAAAIETQKLAIKLLSGTGDAWQYEERYQQRLELYRKGQAYRE